jgi:hypothetical protein
MTSEVVAANEVRRITFVVAYHTNPCPATWAQFFDDGACTKSLSHFAVSALMLKVANIIIFLASLSGFNQTLAEEDKTNRLVSFLPFLCQGNLLMVAFR